jgi:hypothetical protein
MRSQVDELIPEAEVEFEKSSFPVLFCDVRFRPKKNAEKYVFCDKVVSTASWVQCYKPFYVRNLQRLIIS